MSGDAESKEGARHAIDLLTDGRARALFPKYETAAARTAREFDLQHLELDAPARSLRIRTGRRWLAAAAAVLVAIGSWTWLSRSPERHRNLFAALPEVYAPRGDRGEEAADFEIGDDVQLSVRAAIRSRAAVLWLEMAPSPKAAFVPLPERWQEVLPDRDSELLGTGLSIDAGTPAGTHYFIVLLSAWDREVPNVAGIEQRLQEALSNGVGVRDAVDKALANTPAEARVTPVRVNAQ